VAQDPLVIGIIDYTDIVLHGVRDRLL